MRALRSIPGRRRAAVLISVLTLLAATAAAAPARAAQPGRQYTGMGTCPLQSAQLQNPDDGSVGCVVAVVNGGSFTVGKTVVPLPASSPITAKFGVYWPNDGPTVTFPDGSTADIFSTVAPTDGRELATSPLDVPIPGLADFWPGVASALVQVELAGPITGFTPLSAGEDYPLFRLPIKLHLLNAFLGLNCYIGSNSAPILLQPTAGTTSPPPPNQPVTGNPGTISLDPDPNGFGAAIVGFAGGTLVDNAQAVPAANGCGWFGGADWIVDLLFGLPSAAGHNALTFAGVNTSLAVDTSISDLTNAIQATEK